MNPVRLVTLIAALILFAAPFASEAQQGGWVCRIGYLTPASSCNSIDAGFDRALKDLKYGR